jgi:hypothetical protein
MAVMEKEIEQKLIAIVAKHGGNCLKWVCPGWSGVPDRIVLLPGAGLLFVETKRPKGGRFSNMQKWWERRLIGLGFDYWRVYDHNDLDDIERYIAELMRT